MESVKFVFIVNVRWCLCARYLPVGGIHDEQRLRAHVVHLEADKSSLRHKLLAAERSVTQVEGMLRESGDAAAQLELVQQQVLSKEEV